MVGKIFIFRDLLTTLSMAAFRIAINNKSDRTIWGYLFFVGLAIGLLAKGPVALVMIGLPTFLWTLWRRKWSQVRQQLPWVTGLLLMNLLSAPWYLLAEYKTYGFLEYFFVGEHWKRFMVRGCKGDLYGSAHAMPRGIIWLFWLLAAFPWSFAFLYAARNKISRSKLKAFWREKKMECFSSPVDLDTDDVFFVGREHSLDIRSGRSARICSFYEWIVSIPERKYSSRG